MTATIGKPTPLVGRIPLHPSVPALGRGLSTNHEITGSVFVSSQQNVGKINLAPPVGVVNLAPPVGVVNLTPPVGVVNLAPPVGVVNLAPPVGVVNLASPVM